ncbi:MAG: hypothetical protein OFPI_31670 [Osedax symbiont Rs2]|nr:MAG: hypothetical protein OFPI_31670 [Osedax symbiont Rs2]
MLLQQSLPKLSIISQQSPRQILLQFSAYMEPNNKDVLIQRLE